MTSASLTPRFDVFRAQHPDAPLYAFLTWNSQQRARFHEAQRAVGGHRWQDTHDCLDCHEANRSGEFDAWLQDGAR